MIFRASKARSSGLGWAPAAAPHAFSSATERRSRSSGLNSFRCMGHDSVIKSSAAQWVPYETRHKGLILLSGAWIPRRCRPPQRIRLSGAATVHKYRNTIFLGDKNFLTYLELSWGGQSRASAYRRPLPGSVAGRAVLSEEFMDSEECENIMRIPLARLWTQEELDNLVLFLRDGHPVSRIARRLHRTQSSVRGKMVQLGLRSAGSRPQIARTREALRQGSGRLGYAPSSDNMRG